MGGMQCLESVAEALRGWHKPCAQVAATAGMPTYTPVCVCVHHLPRIFLPCMPPASCMLHPALPAAAALVMPTSVVI